MVKGFSLSSESYDRALEDVFEVQEDIAQLVVSALEVRLTEDERRVLEKPPTADLRAYDFYLRGQGLVHQLRLEALAQAREMFGAAIETDPSFALAHAGLANACSWLHPLCGRRPELLAEALSASARALELRPDLAEAHGARGLALALSRDVDAAETEYRMAIALNPRLFEPHYSYARTCLEQGRLAMGPALRAGRATAARGLSEPVPPFDGLQRPWPARKGARASAPRRWRPAPVTSRGIPRTHGRRT